MKANARVFVGAALVAGVAWYMLRGRLTMPALSDFVPSPAGVRAGVGSVGEYAGAAAVGAVEGIGLAVGIPRTNMTECERAKAEGRWWDASFACPAADFVSGVWNSTSVSNATQADVRRVDNAIDYTDPANPYQNGAGYDFRYF